MVKQSQAYKKSMVKGGGLWRFLNKMEKDTDKAHNMITPKCQDKEHARVEIKQQIVQYNL